MKKKILISLACLALIATWGGIMSYAPPPSINDIAPPSGSYSTGTFPLFTTPKDTVVTTGTDTFKINMRKGWSTSTKNTLNSVTFTSEVWKVAGTPTVQIACYASANNGASYDPTPITSYTVYPSSLTAPVNKTYPINSGNGWIYTDLMWVTTGSASSTISHRDEVLLR